MVSHAHHSAADLAEWNAYALATRNAADAVGALALWTSTAQVFDNRPVTARPLIMRPEERVSGPIYASPWGPVPIGGGQWINAPAEQYGWVDCSKVALDGPVNTITQVTIDGAVVAPGSYRVDEGMWLVRTDGQLWPYWQDVALAAGQPGTFVVSYTAGLVPPAALLAAAGTYALEWARASSPQSSTLCRLPSRAKSITRQGVTIDMVDPTTLLEAGLTGLPDVDAVIMALNPRKVHHRPRVMIPGLYARKTG